MLGFPILYLKGMRIMMFQLSGFYYKGIPTEPSSRDFGKVWEGAPSERLDQGARGSPRSSVLPRFRGLGV